MKMARSEVATKALMAIETRGNRSLIPSTKASALKTKPAITEGRRSRRLLAVSRRQAITGQMPIIKMSAIASGPVARS